MKLVYCLAILLFAFSSCKKKSDFPSNVPDCIKEEIQNQTSGQTQFLKSVDEYSFQGKTVYVFTPDSAIVDGLFSVTDSQCNTICYLGGIAGMRMCNGDKFDDKAVFVRNIWHK